LGETGEELNAMTDDGNRGVTTILNGARPESRRLAGAMQSGSSNLADLLERVLDKGIIIAGDVTLCLGEIELLQIKIRLLIASVDRASAMGIDWWRNDPALSSSAHRAPDERYQLTQRLDRLETLLAPLVKERENQLPSRDAFASSHAAEASP
jgi:gas vesicle protein GvpA/GvpJ/GvpM family